VTLRVALDDPVRDQLECRPLSLRQRRQAGLGVRDQPQRAPLPPVERAGRCDPAADRARRSPPAPQSPLERGHPGTQELGAAGARVHVDGGGPGRAAVGFIVRAHRALGVEQEGHCRIALGRKPQERLLGEIAGTLKTSPVNALASVEKLQNELRARERELASLQKAATGGQVEQLAAGARQVDGFKLVTHAVGEGADRLEASLRGFGSIST